jgi:hypothetical protein
LSKHFANRALIFGDLQIDRDANSPELLNVGHDYNAALEYSSTSTTMPAKFSKCKPSCDLKTLEWCLKG